MSWERYRHVDFLLMRESNCRFLQAIYKMCKDCAILENSTIFNYLCTLYYTQWLVEKRVF